MRYIGTGPRDEAAARANLEWFMAQSRHPPFGYWVLRERGTGDGVGGAMLMVRREGLPVELGFLLAQSASAGASRPRRRRSSPALGTLQVPLIEAFIDVNNAASGAVFARPECATRAFARDLTAGPIGSSRSPAKTGSRAWRDARSRLRTPRATLRR